LKNTSVKRVAKESEIESILEEFHSETLCKIHQMVLMDMRKFPGGAKYRYCINWIDFQNQFFLESATKTCKEVTGEIALIASTLPHYSI